MAVVYNLYIYGVNSSVPNELVADVTFLDDKDESIDMMAVMPINGLTKELEIIAHISEDAMLAITGILNVILDCCPNKRVVHLAKHGKKKRTRKKNLHRAIKILEGMSNGSC